MKIASTLLLSLLLTAMAAAQIHVQVEPADTAKPNLPSEAPDQTSLVDAMKLDGVLRTAEMQLRGYSRFLALHRSEKLLADSVRKDIAAAMVQEQIALWNFQIERALQYQDTILLGAMQAGLAELAKDKTILKEKIAAAGKRLDKLLEPRGK